MDLQEDFDCPLFFDHTRKSAEAAYSQNPLDAENLNSESEGRKLLEDEDKQGIKPKVQLPKG